MKRRTFMNKWQLQRCARFGTPRICSYSGIPRPHVRRYEALPLGCKDENLKGIKNEDMSNQPVLLSVAGSFVIGF